MAEIKFTIQSLDDLEDIAEYVGKDSAHYAGMQIQKLINRTDILTKFTLIGCIVPKFKTRSIRETIEGNYRKVYRVVNKSLVHILTFHHSRRKLRTTAIRKIIQKNK